MKFTHQAAAGIAILIACAGCASQEKRKTVSETDNQKTQAMNEQMVYRNNLAANQNACRSLQAAGVATTAPPITPSKDTAQISAPSGTSGCNCSCLSNPNKATNEE